MLKRLRLKSFLQGRGVILQREFQLPHRVIAVASDEVGSGAVGKIDLLCEVLDCVVVLVNPLIAHSSIVQVLQVLGVRLQSHRVISNRLVEQSDSHVAVSAVGIALAVDFVQLNLLGKVLNCLLELLHLAVDKADVGVSNGVVRIEGEGFEEVRDGVLVFLHVFEAASSVVIED